MICLLVCRTHRRSRGNDQTSVNVIRSISTCQSIGMYGNDIVIITEFTCCGRETKVVHRGQMHTIQNEAFRPSIRPVRISRDRQSFVLISNGYRGLGFTITKRWTTARGDARLTVSIVIVMQCSIVDHHRDVGMHTLWRFLVRQRRIEQFEKLRYMISSIIIRIRIHDDSHSIEIVFVAKNRSLSREKQKRGSLIDSSEDMFSPVSLGSLTYQMANPSPNKCFDAPWTLKLTCISQSG